MKRGRSYIFSSVGDLFRYWRPAFTLDLHALALFRVALGCLVLVDLLMRLGDFSAHYSESGVMPLSAAAAFSSAEALLPLHLFHSSDVWQAGLFLVGVLFSIGVISGLFTRWCVLGVWIVLGAIHARNPLVLYGADTLLMCLLFWSFFLPLGTRWGVDALRFGRRGKGSVVSVGSVAFVCQITVVYLFSFLSKSGEAWWNGEAVGIVLQLDQYTSPLGSGLLAYSGLLIGATWATMGIELLAPLLLLFPNARARIIALVSLGSMQVGFAVLMELGLFPFVSLIALIPFFRIRSEATPSIQRFSELSRLAAWREGFALACLVLMLLWNMGVSLVEFQRTRLKSILPGPVVGLIERLRLDQSWSMFSPDPPIEDGWLVFEGTLVDGSRVNLWSLSESLVWEKPEDVSGSFLGDRWKAYLLNLIQRRLSFRSVAELLVREWNVSHSPEQEVAGLTITYMNENTLPFRKPTVERITLYETDRR
jgi:hypothetical protein